MSEQLISTPSSFGDNGNFLLERELGLGGMGGVYMGRDKMLDRPVAVKVMQPEFGKDAEFVEKFKKEAQAAAKLIHPNIAQIYSYGICNDMPYIAMELASGGSLYSLMNANPGKTDIQRVLKVCQQTAQALQCASDQGYVHGDVKPENILFDANGNAKLVDFGLAAMQKDTTEIWGTPYYISPEKVKKEVVDFRADMYSLGGTLYHALTGVAPFDGEDATATVKKRFEGMPKKPSEIREDITPAVDELVMKMLAFDKKDRYPSFEALLEAFKEVLTSGLTGKYPTQPRTTTTTTSKTGKKMLIKKGGTRLTSRTKLTKKLNTEPEDPEVEEKEEAEDEEEKGDNLGLKVILAVVGGLLVIGAIVGGLMWYKAADAKAREAEKQAEIAKGIANAKESIATIKGQIGEFETKFNDFIAQAEKAYNDLKDELTKLDPAKVDELLKDISEKLEVCKACQTNITTLAQNALAECAKAETFEVKDENGAMELGNMSLAIKELYTQMVASKDVETVTKGSAFIKNKGKNLVERTVKRLRIEKLEAERKAKKEAAEAAEKERKEKAEAERKVLVETETAAIKAKFEAIAEQGCFRQLDWKSANRQLNQVVAEFKTAEGEIAAKLEFRKVEDMKKVQDLFIAKITDHVFKGKLKGGKVTSVNEKEIVVSLNGKPKKIGWEKFYKEYPGNFNELINFYIVDGRKNAGLSLREWADVMTGAALTMRLVCSDITGASERAEQLAKETVKQFQDYEKMAKEIFPDISFEGLEE